MDGSFMQMNEKIKKHFQAIQSEAIPQLSVNCVIFGFHDKELKVIVNKFELGDTTILLLPGGFIKQSEDVNDAVRRVVSESTGLGNILLRQFAVFGDASRSFGEEYHFFLQPNGVEEKKMLEFVSKRFVTICYLALVDFDKIELKPAQGLQSVQWLPVERSKTLDIDHHDIVTSARAQLLRELPYLPIASNLLPSEFTLPDLHALVESILGRPVDRPNFRRKILKSDMILKVGQAAAGKRRPADLYTFRHGKNTSLTEEFKFGF